MTPAVRRWLVVITLTASTSGPVLSRVAAAEEAAAAEDTVVLPPIIVDEGRKLRWSYVEIPGLQLLTTGSANTARQFAETFHRQEQLVRVLVPDQYLWHTSIPARYLLVDPPRSGVNNPLLRAYFDQARERNDGSANRRARFIPNLRLNDDDSVVVYSSLEGIGEENRVFDFMARAMSRYDSETATASFQFTADRIHALLSRRAPALPDWLVAGLTGLYHNCDFSARDILVRTAVWRTPGEADALRRDPDRPRNVLPLATLLTQPPPARDAPLRHAWEDQAVLFVRWGLFADGQAHRDRFWRYIDLLDTEVSTEAIFKECLGLNFADARDRLSDYLPIAVQESFRLEPDHPTPPPEIKVRRATPTEVARLRSEWERLEVIFTRRFHPELTELYLNHARGALAEGRQVAGEDPELLAINGQLEFEAGNGAAARPDLENAIARGVRRPSALLALAALRYEEMIAANGPGKPLDPGQTGQVRILLQAALDQEPPLAKVYTLLADMWLHSELIPVDEDLDTLAAGARRFPGEPAVVGRVALVIAVQGHKRWALDLINFGLGHTHDPDNRTLYRKLGTQLRDLGNQPGG